MGEGVSSQAIKDQRCRNNEESEPTKHQLAGSIEVVELENAVRKV